MEQKIVKMINILIFELHLSRDEARIFLFLTRNGKSNVSRICADLGIEERLVTSALNGLVDHGMIFGLNSLDFDTFHPRFSIANCYRIRCEKLGMGIKRNSKLDAMGAMLEVDYESARPK